MKVFSQFATFAATSGIAIATSIAPVYAGTFATDVIEYNPGQGQIQNYDGTGNAYRLETNNALGAPQADRTRNFLSLGIGGSAIFGFDGFFSGSVTVWETTWGELTRQNQYDERIEVFVGNDLDNWLSIGEIWNIRDGAFDTDQDNNLAGLGATLDIGNNELYQYVRLVDKSQNGGGRDGFDINAIAVTPADVPEPTVMLGLLAVGGAMVKTRRDRKS